MSDTPVPLAAASHLACSQQVLELARRNVSKSTWDYLNGAAQSETTMRRNRFALDSYAFLPRVLRDVSNIEIATTLIGGRSRLPLVLAPIGSMQLFGNGGACAASQAAGAFGVPHILSSVARYEVGEVAAANSGRKLYQLYIRGDLDWIAAKLDAARSAGFEALVITADAPVYGLRERQMLNSFGRPSDTVEGSAAYQATMTWDRLADIKRIWGGPMILKGIATAADARLAVDSGMDVVYVSNHGGRDLDHNRGTMEMLPEIVDAVGARAEVWVDGGFVRGTDIVKALCLGARAVGIARLQGWAICAGGAPAMLQVLLNLEEEIRNCMGLIGATRLADLGKEYLTRVTPLGPWHEHASFRHLGANWAEGLR